MAIYNDDKWNAVTGADVEPFLKQVNPIEGRHNVSAPSAQIEWRQMSFYQNIALVRVNDRSWPMNTGPFFFLAKQGKMLLLNGSSAPIHEANELAPIKVTEDIALDYLRFFCYFVHGEDGPFFVVEDINHPALDLEKMDPATRKVLEGAIRPAMLEGAGDNGSLVTSAMILYGNALFAARFSMTSDSMIEMTDDEPIAADLPVRKIKPNY
jgi:hypothetical protein